MKIIKKIVPKSRNRCNICGKKITLKDFMNNYNHSHNQEKSYDNDSKATKTWTSKYIFPICCLCVSSLKWSIVYLIRRSFNCPDAVILYVYDDVGNLMYSSSRVNIMQLRKILFWRNKLMSNPKCFIRHS